MTPEERRLNDDMMDFLEGLSFFNIKGKYAGCFGRLITEAIQEAVQESVLPELKKYVSDIVANALVGLCHQRFGIEITANPDIELLNTIHAAFPRCKATTYRINTRACPFCGGKIGVISTPDKNAKGIEKTRVYKCEDCKRSWPSLELFFI